MEDRGRTLSIAVLVAGLGPGGAERVAVRICDWLCDAGHEVCLLTLSAPDTDFYACPQGVERVALALEGESGCALAALRANLQRLRAVRAAVRARHVDVVVSLGANSNVLMLLALAGLRCRKIISERADPVLQPLSRSWNWLRRMTYPWASLHVAQSKFMLEWARENFPRLPGIVIGNTPGRSHANIVADRGEKRAGGGTLRMLAVGRFTPEKGMDILLDAFAAARPYFRVPVQLDIVGDGPLREVLVSQCARLGLSGAVSFNGNVADVWPCLLNADFYVLSSLSEGFPNSLVEAMTAGLPVISARCRGGVEDILGEVPNEYGLEFPPGDAAALARCMIELANSPQLRANLGHSARRRAEDYSPGRISAAWINVVETA